MLYGRILLYVRPQDYVAPPLLAKVGPVRIYVTLVRENALEVANTFPLFLILHKVLQVCLIGAQKLAVHAVLRAVDSLHHLGRSTAP